MVLKMRSFFFCKLHLITVLLLICDFDMSYSIRFVYLKLCGGFSIFDSVSFILKFIILFNKIHRLFDFKTTIPFKLKLYVPRTLIFRLQQEFLKFDDICVCWSFPKTDLLTNFLNLENQSFSQ